MNAILINSLAGGGAEKVVLTVLTELIKREHHMLLICLERNLFYEIPDHMNVIYLSQETGHEYGIKKIFNLPRLAMKLKRIIKKYHIDVVQSHLFRANYVNILARLSGSDHIVQIVNTGSITTKYGSGLQGKVNLLLIKWLYPYADLIITKSKGMIAELDQQFCFNVPKKVIYNPSLRPLIESQQKEPFSSNEFQFQANRRYIITMSRLHPCKHLDILMNAFESIANQLIDTDLVILGEGEERRNLDQLIHNLQLNHRIFLLGHVNNPYKYLARSALFVLTSSNEGFPNSLIEAMICKLPVISTDCVSGPREILAPDTDENQHIQNTIEYAPYGVLVPVNNKPLLSKAISDMLGDSSTCKFYADKGYERACMFSKDHIIDEYEKTIMGCEKNSCMKAK
jgi:N-acetylgalactosamine-N,N'-diacetylbacillosaminyl-diphospho-undecaprenol 4-alpha-N-acetylgalactosaminyltransferase